MSSPASSPSETHRADPGIDSPYPLTAAQIEAYRRDGFVKLKHVLSAEVLAHYGRIISSEVIRLNTMHLPLEQRDTYHKAFLQVGNIWTQNEKVREFCWSQRLGRIAAELMGVRGVRMYHDQALYKEPGGGITPWHADQYYWPLAGDNSITAWVPLQATPPELGPLAFAVGSHRFQEGRDLVISDESEAKIGRSLKERNYPVSNEPFELGEVSFHSGWTFHRADPNVSERPRRVMTIIYIEDGIRLAEPRTKARQLDREKFMADVEVGAVIDGKMTPVIYRAP
jgi:ectoine hydroxylase-related dioxygenase (phytanoyl-CoA dioxygenase family)